MIPSSILGAPALSLPAPSADAPAPGASAILSFPVESGNACGRLAALGRPAHECAPIAAARATGKQSCCVVGGCRSPRHSTHTGFCEAHHECYLNRLHDMARGDLSLEDER